MSFVKMFGHLEGYVILLVVAVFHVNAYQYTVKIYPNILSQNGRTHFESDRWNGHNGLDPEQYIAGNLAIGAKTGRWLNPDLGGVFPNATEDPTRPGYADPNYFKRPDLQQRLNGQYAADLKGYGKNLTLVADVKGQFWPSWLDTSMHGGVFPNNLDAAADMILMMVEAMSDYTGGVIPPYFEVINEPETLYQHVSWDIIIQFHQIVAQKLHKRFPDIKVCGPTNDDDIEISDANDFKFWLTVRDFMDMSLYDLDILTFHPYNTFYSENGKHNFTGANEERFVAVLDLVEAYAVREIGKQVPVIISEYGLGPVVVDHQTTKAMVQWAYLYQHNAHVFTYLNHRGVMEKAVAFLLCVDPFEFGNSSLFYGNGTETPVAQVYRFWGHLKDSDQFLRVESEFSGSERTVSPLAVVNPNTNNVTVLLHNYATSSVDITLDFDSNWAKPTSADATCMFLNAAGVPVYVAKETVVVRDNSVQMGPESSCFFTFHTDYNFHSSPVFEEQTLYAKDVVMKLVSNSIKPTLFVSSVRGIQSTILRISISNGNKTAQTLPTRIQVNGRGVDTTKFFVLYGRDDAKVQTQWKVYSYKVPADIWVQGDNTITLEFAQSGGYVSSIALLVGTISE